MEIIANLQVWPLMFVFARILGAIAVCPLFSTSFLSNLLRASLALLITAIIYPKFIFLPTSADYLPNVVLIFSNFCYGGLIGYLLSLPIWLIESCGNLIDLQRGEQMGAVLNQLTSTPASSIGKLMVKAFITYLVVNNGILFFFDSIMNSFTLVTPNQLFPVISAPQVSKYIGFFSSYLYWVVALVLPLLAVMFLIDAVLGLISSFLPQLNVTVISMPIKSASVLLILSIYIGYLFHNVFTNFIL